MIDSLDALARWTLCAETGCPCPNHGIPELSLTDFEALSDAPTFRHLSRTNDIASALEESIIRGKIADLNVCHEQTAACGITLRAFRAKLMAQVVRVDEQLKALSQERLRIAQARQKRKSLLHPARRLPNEILAHIFSFCVDFPIPHTFRESAGLSTWWRFDILRNYSSLWAIELICQRWRTTVLGTPSLWSKVNIILDSKDFDTVQLPRLARQLNRAGQSKLYICICQSPVTQEALPFQVPILLFPFASRIKEIHVFGPSVLVQGLAKLRNDFHALSKVAILATPFADTDPNITNVFDRAPQLHSYETTDVIFVDSLLKVPWGQLQRFTTDHSRLNMHKLTLGPGPTPSIILRALTLAINLKECSLRLEYGSHSVLPTVMCTRLSTLRITAWPYTIAHAMRQLITHLILPSLKELVIKNETLGLGKDRDNAPTFAAVLRMVQISGARLTVLHYDKGEVDEQDLIELLKSTRLLEDLQLTNTGASGVTDNVLSELSPNDSLQLLVPRLHTLYLSGVPGFNGSLFSTMVHSRWGTAPFKRINMCWSRKFASGLPYSTYSAALLKGTIESSLSVYGPALELSIDI